MSAFLGPIHYWLYNKIIKAFKKKVEVWRDRSYTVEELMLHDEILDEREA